MWSFLCHIVSAISSLLPPPPVMSRASSQKCADKQPAVQVSLTSLEDYSIHDFFFQDRSERNRGKSWYRRCQNRTWHRAHKSCTSWVCKSWLLAASCPIRALECPQGGASRGEARCRFNENWPWCYSVHAKYDGAPRCTQRSSRRQLSREGARVWGRYPAHPQHFGWQQPDLRSGWSAPAVRTRVMESWLGEGGHCPGWEIRSTRWRRKNRAAEAASQLEGGAGRFRIMGCGCVWLRCAIITSNQNSCWPYLK